MKVMLYRGLRIDKDEVEEVISRIKTEGLKGNEGRYRFYGYNLREHIEKLFHKSDLSTDDTRYSFKEEFSVVAFADILGAHYYALKHGRSHNEVPVVIKVEIDLERKYVTLDGRDFLYSIFLGWDKCDFRIRGIREAFEIIEGMLVEIYGEKMGKYFEKAAGSKDVDYNYRSAICDLAVHDLDIVKVHLKNKIVINGRYGVIFRSAFFVEAPITPDEIKEVFIPEINKFKFKPDIRFSDLFCNSFGSKADRSRFLRLWRDYRKRFLEKNFSATDCRNRLLLSRSSDSEVSC